MKNILSNLNLFYQKNKSIKDILAASPIETGKDVDFEVHTLVCEEDFLMSLWSIKSFYYYSGLQPKLVIHDDGSLSASSQETYLKLFKNCVVINPETARKDLDVFLQNYPFSQEFRRKKDFYCSLKLFDNFYYCSSDHLLHLDPDIFFFQKPTEMLNHITHHKAFFMSDYQDAYSFETDYIKNAFEIKLEPCINAGFMYMSKESHKKSLPLIEAYFEKISKQNYTGLINRHEQTLNAMILSQSHAARLSGAYQISDQPITNQTVIQHFVADDTASRNNLYTLGLKRLSFKKFFTHAVT